MYSKHNEGKSVVAERLIRTLKVDCNHACLAVISLNSALKRDENYYCQAFLKECKYIKKKLIRHIIDNLEFFSDGSDDSDQE